MSKFLKDAYRSIAPYTPGEQPKDRSFIKLNTNESPFPPCRGVLEAVKENDLSSLRLYSDPENEELEKAIASYYGVERSNVLASNGSDEILAFIFCAFFDEKHEVCFPDITYGFYPVFCNFASLKINEIPLKDDFTVDVDAFVNTDKNVVVANPNAPTGIALSVSDIRRILDASPDRLVVVDEAYVDFGSYSCVPLIKEYGNLIVVQTFSKSRSLAGARLGMCFACDSLIADLKTVKFSFNPYNVNRLTSLCGVAAIKDENYFNYCRAEIMKNRAFTARELKNAGFEVLPSNANFLFAKKEGFGGKRLYSALREKGILVRHFDKPRIKDFIRITVGDETQMKTFVAAVKDIIGGTL